MDLDPANLFVSLMVGLVGVALLTWGRSQTRIPHMVGGVVLIVATFFVYGWPWLLLVTALVIVGLALVSRAS